jgi:hypothetical protein
MVARHVLQIHLVKTHTIANSLATTEARKKNCTDFESLEFRKFFDISLTKIRNNQIYTIKLAIDF